MIRRENHTSMEHEIWSSLKSSEPTLEASHRVGGLPPGIGGQVTNSGKTRQLTPGVGVVEKSVGETGAENRGGGEQQIAYLNGRGKANCR